MLPIRGKMFGQRHKGTVNAKVFLYCESSMLIILQFWNYSLSKSVVVLASLYLLHLSLSHYHIWYGSAMNLWLIIFTPLQTVNTFLLSLLVLLSQRVILIILISAVHPLPPQIKSPLSKCCLSLIVWFSAKIEELRWSLLHKCLN